MAGIGHHGITSRILGSADADMLLTIIASFDGESSSPGITAIAGLCYGALVIGTRPPKGYRGEDTGIHILAEDDGKGHRSYPYRAGRV